MGPGIFTPVDQRTNTDPAIAILLNGTNNSYNRKVFSATSEVT